MELAFAMLADNAISQPDGKLFIAGGDFDVIYAPHFPAIHPHLVLVVRISYESKDLVEAQHEYNLRVEFIDPAGNPVFSPATLGFTPLPQTLFPGRPLKHTILVSLPMLFLPTEGAYEFRLFVDDQEIGTLPLYATVQAPPQGTSSQHSQDTEGEANQ